MCVVFCCRCSFGIAPKMSSVVKSHIDGFQMTVNYQQVVQLVDKYLENDTKYLQLHDLLNASAGKLQLYEIIMMRMKASY